MSTRLRSAAHDGAPGVSASPPAPVPVLLYHAVSRDPGSHIAPFTVTPDVFDEHLDVLVGSGLEVITAGDLQRRRAAGPVDGRSTVVLTFDDGYADFATVVLPRLLAHRLSATLYVTTGWMAGRRDSEPGPSDEMLDAAAVREVAAAGVEVGAHSHSHPQMDTLGRAALREELVRPRAELEDLLGGEVRTLAYPHGYSGPRVRALAEAAGYTSAAGVRQALSPADDDPYGFARLMVTSSTSAQDIGGWLRGQAEVAAPRERLATRGWRAYRRALAVGRRTPGSVYR